MRREGFFALVLTIFSTTVFGQDVKVDGYFLSDTIKIGEPTPYVLKVRYPSNQTILFPDSTFDLSSFEIARKRFFPTKTTGGSSLDSAIYWLTTYNIDPVQRLALPVFLVQNQDSTVILSKPDSIFLLELVKQVPDSVSAKELPLKTNTAYQRVSWIFNYPLLLIILTSLLVLFIVGWLVFRKQIKRFFVLRRLTRNHVQFMERYKQIQERLEGSFSRPLAEDAMSIWKKYMEGLVGEPYTRSTTKELKQFITDKGLINTLHHIDVIVYGQSNGNELNHFRELRQFAEQAFSKKQEEVKHG